MSIKSFFKNTRNQRLFLRFLSIGTFSLSLLFFSGVLHEFFHSRVLEYYNCPYESNLSPFESLVINPYCKLSETQSIIVLIAGPVGGILVGSLFFYLAIRISELGLPSILASVGAGLYIRESIGFFIDKSDITHILEELNFILPPFFLHLTGLMIVITSLYFYKITLDKAKG